MQLNLHIDPLTDSEEVPFDLLELADPSKEQIESYIRTGTCYIAKAASTTIGVVVLEKVDSTTIEIKNIAVKATEQGKGYGKTLLKHAEKMGREAGFEQLLIGTGNSSIGQLALYQKEGFELDSIQKNFFIQNYAAPIFENGIQCKHKVLLKKNLMNQ